jgi:predicted RecA/RadA family phage recombinase
MTNYIQQGHVIDVVAPSGGYTGGELVVIGTLVGIANTTVLEGELCAISLSGVYEIPKLTGALAVGAKVYTDAGAGG